MQVRTTGSVPLPSFGPLSFYVQHHWTRRPHYDLHLEVEGRLIGWMLPKAPAPDPAARRFALRTADRELEFGHFEGVLPPGEPGAGVVMVWDLGTYQPYPPAGLTAEAWIARGLLRLHFHGEKLRGLWEMVRWHHVPGEPETWVLVKLRDRHLAPAGALEADDVSAVTGRNREQIAAEARPGAGLTGAVPGLVASSGR